ncbi:MAG: hypothetical protein HYY58_00255 [Candidatus Omnitrophica bacterium]|nr:hypothetical protein [Candidatus Omnitrophota bacterium]
MDRRMSAGLAGIALLITTGCAVNLAKRSPWDIQQLSQLSDQLEQFKTLAQLKAEEADQLRAAKALLEQRLSSSEASVGYDERGLVARMLDQVLFGSGKAELRRSALRATPITNRSDIRGGRTTKPCRSPAPTVSLITSWSDTGSTGAGSR